MRRAVAGLIIAFVIMHVLFFVLKYYVTGVPYALAARVHILAMQQFIMICGTAFIWCQLSPAIDFFLTGSLQPERTRAICAQDVARALLILMLVFTHLCSLFYYIWVGAEPNVLAVISLTSVAIYIHVIFFLLLFLLIQAICHIALRIDDSRFDFVRPLIMNELLHRIFAVALAIAFVVAGLWVTSLPPVIYRVTVPIKNLPQAQEGFRIALLSDLHIGPTVGRAKVERTVAITNALKPDLIAIAGDLADGFVQHLYGAALPLRNLSSKHGTYFATGIVRGHAMDYKKALRGCRRNDTIIILMHQPNAARMLLNDVETAEDVDLILSGQ
ncbi:unnamed protein product [Gongylonema pulchrum]|uniref:Metallophos domain-containing protein n=1 Tax=Gongylonema pulchrum TaxID=637853 RepID=A0A183CZ40_9BILA|nr:unnamed protein product [Gongylonema pulchrum]